jgi:hypothetical protein
MDTAAEFRNLEQRLLDHAVRTNAALLAELLHDDFIEFGSSGRVWNKKSIIAAMSDEPPVERRVEDFTATLLSSDVALVTYRIVRPSEPVSCTNRSSIWMRVDGRWRMRFHQGTHSEI